MRQVGLGKAVAIHVSLAEPASAQFRGGLSALAPASHLYSSAAFC